MASKTPLRPEQIEERLDEYVEVVLSSRRTATEPARKLATFSREQQEFVLHWVSIIARTNAEMAYQFSNHAPHALYVLGHESMEAWILQAMDVFDKSGLHAGVIVLQDLDSYTQKQQAKANGLAVEEISGILETFIHGLSGRTLKIEPTPDSQEIYTDTETLFLPALINRFASRDENFRLYKAMAVYLWAQNWFGTWRNSDLMTVLSSFPDGGRALQQFHALERLRLDAKLKYELPGTHREMKLLRGECNETLVPVGWDSIMSRLSQPKATLDDSLALLAQVYGNPVPQPLIYQGKLYPDRVETVRALRIERDKKMFRTALAHLENEQKKHDIKHLQLVENKQPNRFEFQDNKHPDRPENITFDLMLDGQPIIPPDDVKSVMASIIQDLGEIPQEYLVAAGDGIYIADQDNTQQDPSEVWKGTYHEEGAYLYNEWDYTRKHYRKNWAVLRELDVHPQWDNFVSRTINKYGHLVKQLRRTFEALRGENKTLKKQPHGEDIDIDALVDAYADMSSGMEMENRVFTKMHKLERNIAVMIMVDMSGSTKGWINDAEREALALLCESLETLGDRYAIYGFSSLTRKRCEVFHVKRFDEPYNDEVRARISGIRPQDYTRMGVVIRHLTRLLNEIEAKTKLLITLSDGKPDDYDGYRGTYGIEDTRQALIEAKHDGIHPFCITIDTEASEYLPHMYGAVNYIVIDQVSKLPLKVSDIYRKLTT